MIISLKKGGDIHIKEKNKGKFTSYCGGKVTSACIAKAKASGNPTLVKRATFAANARKWKHLEGGIILPEVTVVPTRLVLDTYYPIIGKKFRYTGHSALRAISPEYTVDTEDGFKVIPGKRAFINKRPSDSGYNFFTNNCADATRCALEAITGKKMNPYFFTTPGDVLDFFKDNFDDVREIKNKNSGKKTYYTNITPKLLEIIKDLQKLLQRSNRKLLAKKHLNGGSIKKFLAGKQMIIPKKRTVLRTIPLSNGSKLTAEQDTTGLIRGIFWFRDNKYITPLQLKKYKFYDSNIKSYRQLNSFTNMDKNGKLTVSTPLYAPNLDWLSKTSDAESRYKLASKLLIPYKGLKIITLKTKGNMNLADVPVNMLDSIAVNAGRSNTDFWTSAALVGKESTFGGMSKTLHGDNEILYGMEDGKFSPSTLTNNHSYFSSPESDYWNALFNKYLKGVTGSDDEERLKAEADVKYAREHGQIVLRTPQYSLYVLADAFKRYNVAPNKYNPGLKNYASMVNGIKLELQGDRLLQEYWNTRGKLQYARGMKEGMKQGGKFRKFQIGGYVQPSNVQEAINNGSAAGGLLEGFGKVMNKVLPTWFLKAGTYLSPLNYAAALSKGSINPKVGEEVISKWHPNILLAARLGEAVFGGKAVKGAGKATVNTAAKAGNKTARAYLISKEIGKGAINLKELSNQFIEPHVTNPKGSGKVVHYDNGDGKSVFRNSGASIRNGKLVPGQTTRNQSNFTWWNLDNPYLNVHKSQGRFSPSRYIITDLTNQFIHPLKAGKSVGQSDGAGRGFILPTELVSETPVSLENALIWNKSPFGWWERVKTLQPSKITKSKPYVRWSQEGYLNEAYDIDGGPGLKFQVVKDVDNPKKGVLQTKGNGEYSLHFKSSRNNPNKEGMFKALAESIPEGGIVSTWGKISKGGYHGINRFGELFGWTKVGERPAVNGPVNMFLKPSLLKTEDNPFKSNLDTKAFIQRFMYLSALHDPKHALSNPYSIVKPKAVNTSNKVQSIMNNIIFPRLLRNRPWMKNVGQNFNLGDIYEFDKDIFEKAGDPSEGFYNPKTGDIVRKRGSERFTPDEIDSHELRHRADAEYPYTEYEQQVTDRAFEGFLNAKPEDYGESYNMSVEIPTTISDARNTLLDANNMKEIPAHWEGPDKWVEASGAPWYELPLEEQDALINTATDTEIINAYRRSNGYGRRFIEYLENNKLLTPERIKDLREALIVGSLSAPLLMNRKEEKK